MSADVMVADRVTGSRVAVGAAGACSVAAASANSATSGAVVASTVIPGAMMSGVVVPGSAAISVGVKKGKLPVGGERDSSDFISAEHALSDIARDFVELTKPRIVTMILVTTLIAAVVASGGEMAGGILFHLLVGVALVAGSAGAMNQVWERAIDSQMERTRRRPLPAGRMTAGTAAIFSAATGIAGTIYLVMTVGWIPAMVGLVTWITYVPIYTPLKTRSAWNTTVGAVSGALPVMIGYTAAGGHVADMRGWLLVGVLVAWQYPHFMAIAWLYRRQYAEAGFRMTTTVEPTGRSAGWQSVVGMTTLILCLVGLAVTSPSDSLVALISWSTVLVLVSAPMMIAAIRFAADRNDFTARKLLRASLLQLPASLLLVMAAALLG